MTDPALTCTDLSKRFGSAEALVGVDLEIDPGEVVSVVGPSGCGKSTLLRSIAGLAGVDRGTITLAGRTVTGPGCFVPTEQRPVGLVFQDLALFPHLTAEDNIAFGLRQRRRGDARKRIAAMLETVGLADKAKRYPHELSGGEQQRVAIGRALALEPELVLLDEPFSHLDVGLAAHVRTEAMATLRASGAAVLLVTHDQDEALAVSDRIAVMRAGRFEQVDTPAACYHRPATEHVATFLGEADFLPGEGDGTTVTTALGPLNAPGLTGASRVMVRPHDLALVADGVEAIVERTEFRGAEVLHVLRLATQEVVRVVTRHEEAAATGDQVRVGVATQHPLIGFTS